MEDNIRNQLVGNIYWKDGQGRYLGCNEAFAKANGFISPTDIIGKFDSDFIKNQTHLKMIQKTDQLIIQSGEEMTVEEAILDPQGNLAFYLTQKAPLRDKNQHIIGVIGTSIPMTKQFDMKDYIIRHTAGNVYWKDLTGRYLGCNDAFAELIGLAMPDDIIGKNDYELFKDTLGEEGVKTIMDIDQSVMTLGIDRSLEEIGVNKEGQFAVYMTKKIPMYDNNNNIIGLVGTSLDTTKQREAELTKLEFLRNMSHDIMTPFTGILGISSVLYEEEKNPDKKIHLHYLIQSSERLLNLLKQILEITEKEKHPVKLEFFNIKDMVNEMIQMFLASAKHKGLTLKVDCPNDYICSDKLRVTRILLNLLGNAIKFTNSGLIRVQTRSKPYFQLSVEDTGPGIPPDKLDIVFEKFQKLTESGQHNHFAGSGIGLFIAKQFALELGGDIKIKSELGKGSKFTFFLPNAVSC